MIHVLAGRATPTKRRSAKMVDLLDQFESAGLRGPSEQASRRRPQQNINPFDEPDVGSLPARRSVRQYKPVEYPIFKRQDAPFTSPQGITHMVASNGCISLVQPGNIIYRFHLDNPRGAAEHVEIKREGDRIHRVFQDPTGQHLLVCMESKECYYIGSRLPKRSQPKPLQKIKGQLIESVAWNKVDQSEHSTGPILLGTSIGSIFETDIVFEESILKPRRSYFTEVYKLMYDLSDPCEPITGLLLEPFPDKQNKFYVLATTPRRIYQFIGMAGRGDGPVFGDLFAHYDNIKAQFLEIPGSLKDSQLHVWPSHPNRPNSFAWLTGAGVYYGQLGFGDHEPGESLFLDKELIPYTGEHPSEMTPPMGMALTQFHCLLFYRDRVEAICILNQKRVFEDVLNTRRDGPLLGMCVDTTLGSVYTYQRHKVWQYIPYRETRNVWKIFLEQGQYEKAKRYAEGNQEHLDTILIRQAEYYFKEKKFHEAAVLFSQSQLSFEVVTLKFIQVNRKDALKTFLLKKLETLNQKEDSTQQTMLTTWLIELFLNELGGLIDEGDATAHHKLQLQFHKFLEIGALRECLEANRKTVYDLISSHGATDDMMFFATLMKDYEKVITHCIQGYEYKEALRVLLKNAQEALDAPEKERRGRFRRFEGLFYKFSPTLMRHCPADTVKAWIRMDRFLDPRKLIPSLIQCNAPPDETQNVTAAAIQYLEFCVHKLHNTERAIHNFLVSSYTQSKDSTHRNKLLEYLQDQAKYPTVCYDPQYALRLCMEHKLDEPCVHIYAAMGLYEESVELALKVDVDLARSIANIPLKNKDLQKSLWLKIAEHVIKKENNIERAMLFLQECSLLKIEDILPCFPDFVTIEHFKDAICSSLTDYNAHIDDLKTEMQGATDSAKNIRSDIQDIRNKCVVIQSDARCQICESRLLTQAFYMFPCRHAFHRDCLTQEVRRYLSEDKKRELDQLLSAVSASSPPSEGDSIAARTGWDEIKSKVNSIVGSECLYCGDRMIETIDRPFIPPDQMTAALASWK